jgi:predicted secreted protein
LPTQAISAFGVQLRTLDSTYTTVAEVTSIDDLGGTATLVPVTAHDAASAWSSKIPTTLQVGNMRVSLNHVPTHATHDATTGVYKLFHDRIRRPVMIVLPDAGKTTWFMTAITTGFQESLPVNGVLSAVVNLESAGDLVLANA